ncbi:hypothetical protein L1987_32498 [Smallanthus sonchifolius]|uniref:Uncharacterized protein n=1 Tax=Smallanthus sonchifolius TaxID=185202 RepID=A0ACB9HMS5_9ASTR|nr:hypothetical protein L1987_32498 [Smallanthus sonchifolius]
MLDSVRRIVGNEVPGCLLAVREEFGCNISRYARDKKSGRLSLLFLAVREEPATCLSRFYHFARTQFPFGRDRSSPLPVCKGIPTGDRYHGIREELELKRSTRVKETSIREPGMKTEKVGKESNLRRGIS